MTTVVLQLWLTLSLLLHTTVAEIITVAVGRDGDNLALRFSPNVTTASVGDFVQFQFYPLNHSVVQADFDSPCTPSKNATGQAFFSGFNPLPENTKTLTTFTVEVRTTDPIFFYCSQGRHCQQGFVGAINPTTKETLSAFRTLAQKAPYNLSPGETPSRQTISPDPGATATPTNPFASDKTNSGNQSNTSNGNGNGNGGTVMNVGAILGGVLGGVVFMILALSGLVFWVARRRRQRQRSGISQGRTGNFFGGGGNGVGLEKENIGRPMVDPGNMGPFGSGRI